MPKQLANKNAFFKIVFKLFLITLFYIAVTNISYGKDKFYKENNYDFFQNSVENKISKLIGGDIKVRCVFPDTDLLKQIEDISDNDINKLDIKIKENNKTFIATTVCTKRKYRIAIQGKYEIFFPAVCLKNSVKARQNITIDNLKIEYFKNLAPDVETDFRFLNGTTAKIPINKNIPITKSCVKKPFTIHKGDVVGVIYIKQNLTISSKGIAIEKGRIGDIIKIQDIKNTSSILEGKIIDKNTVRVI